MNAMSRLKNISEWMTERGVTLELLVAASGLDKKVVEAIIQNRYTTSPQQRQRLARALDLPPEDIQWSQSVRVDHLYGHGPQFGRSP
jgi:hypothetical protein